jgi:hypothetical protein
VLYGCALPILAVANRFLLLINEPYQYSAL